MKEDSVHIALYLTINHVCTSFDTFFSIIV